MTKKEEIRIYVLEILDDIKSSSSSTAWPACLDELEPWVPTGTFWQRLKHSESYTLKVLREMREEGLILGKKFGPYWVWRPPFTEREKVISDWVQSKGLGPDDYELLSGGYVLVHQDAIVPRK